MQPFQYTLRGLLMASFWTSMSIAAWACFARCLPVSMDFAWLSVMSYFAGWACAFGAVGALLGRTIAGLMAGLVAGMSLFYFAMIMFSR